ncbi:MAG: hypothetical protein K9M84_14400 [Spirochaetia bacterium]|nr:hypothetical protein [Spirochaetia bacterium]
MRRSSMLLLVLGMCVAVSGCMVTEDVITRAVYKTEDRLVESALSGVELNIQRSLFAMVYHQSLFFGGQQQDLADYEESESTVFRVYSSDQSGSSWYEITRALISRESGGNSWWYLKMTGEDGSDAYAVELDRELEPLLVRYRDPERQIIREFTVDLSAGTSPESQMSGSLPDEPLPQRSTRETVTVGAGTFSADRYELSWEDVPDAPAYRYTIWMSDRVPGGVVKFEITSQPEDELLTGELKQIRTDFTTDLVP